MLPTNGGINVISSWNPSNLSLPNVVTWTTFFRKSNTYHWFRMWLRKMDKSSAIVALPIYALLFYTSFWLSFDTSFYLHPFIYILLGALFFLTAIHYFFKAFAYLYTTFFQLYTTFLHSIYFYQKSFYNNRIV